MKFPKPLKSSTFLSIGAIFLLAISIRMAYLHEIQGNPFFENLTLDQTSYDRWARRIAGGDWLGKEIFYQDPLYPYFLGAVYSIIGRDLYWARVIQSIIGSVSCVLIFMIGKNVFSRRAGLLAGVIAALYRPFFYFDAMILKTFLGVFLVCLFLVLLIAARPRRSFLLWLAAGATLGLLALVRANALALAAGAVVWLFFIDRERETSAYRLIASAGFLAGMLLVIAPVSARNYVVGRDFVLLTSQAGQNFYIGNNPLNTSGRYHPPHFIRPNPRHEQEDFRVRAEMSAGRRLKPSEISDYWFEESSRFIRQEPVKWLKLMAKKVWRFWNWYEIPDNQNYQFFKRYSLLLRLPLPNFQVIAAAALAGMVIFLPQWKRFFLLYMTAALYSGTVILFYIFARYRVPMVPVLILFSSFAACEAGAWCKSRKWKRLVAAGALFGVFWLVVGTHVDRNDYYGDDSNAYCRLAAVYELERNWDAALEAYQESIRIMPHYWASYYGLGQVYYRKGETEMALKNYLLARAYNPENPDIPARLGYLYYLKGDLENSIRFYQDASDLKPDWNRPHYWLASLYEAVGDHAKAAIHLDKLKELKFTGTGVP